MRVPLGGRQDDVQQQPTQPPPSLSALLMAAALFKKNREMAGLTEQDEPTMPDSVRTEKGLNVEAEKAARGRKLSTPPGNYERVMRPGEPVTDRMLGVTGGRHVRGI